MECERVSVISSMMMTLIHVAAGRQMHNWHSNWFKISHYYMVGAMTIFFLFASKLLCRVRMFQRKRIGWDVLILGHVNQQFSTEWSVEWQLRSTWLVACMIEMNGIRGCSTRLQCVSCGRAVNESWGRFQKMNFSTSKNFRAGQYTNIMCWTWVTDGQLSWGESWENVGCLRNISQTASAGQR